MQTYLFTSESVTEGHPDKICDQISDAVLDEILTNDPLARVACETIVTTGMVLIMGEITTNTYVDIPAVARKVIREIGYTGEDGGFSSESCAVLVSIDEQSPDIAQGVNEAFEDSSEQGAGDQGMMFGFACNETTELMPLALSLSHRLAKQLTKVRKDGTLPYLRPDGKTQVTVEYDENHTPLRVDTVVVSAQHSEEVLLETLRKDILEQVIQPIIPPEFFKGTKVYINPTGRFVLGGPQGDSGLTGRKIIVDTYGGYGRHGGGAFSGKDPSKVDRSAAYAARYIAKNIVAAGFAERCEVQLAYAIGRAAPVSIQVATFGTGTVTEAVLTQAIRQVFSLTPSGIIASLDLRRPIYRSLAAYGQMGREELDVSWEKTDKVEALQKAIGELSL